MSASTFALGVLVVSIFAVILIALFRDDPPPPIDFEGEE